MSIITLFEGLPDKLTPPRDRRRHPLAAAWQALRTTAYRARVLVAGLIAWFAAEPVRVRACVLGIGACVAAGAVAGAAAGVVVVRVVELLLGVVKGP